ncbi:hypothetical protein ACLQ2R_33425 [Streptosporangium sp. DT93]|uniref:hypothetical protein n=1 Tax=Streptosporangium sp. DT93 TaxID=3393428 RepID=UPI003CF7BA9F
MDSDAEGTLDLAMRATADWLAGKQGNTRVSHLEDVRSWLSHCQNGRVNPLRATPWDIIWWIKGLERSAAAVPVGKRVASVHSWYVHLLHQRICRRDPTEGVQLPSAEPLRPRVRAHTMMASAVLVDYADACASECGTEMADEVVAERAWRDAALLAVWFYTEIAPPALLAVELSALRSIPGGLRLVKPGDGEAVVLAEHADRLVRGYLERRGARLRQRWGQLRGPLLATTPAEEGGLADLPLTGTRVLAILRALADHCGLPHRPRLSPGGAAMSSRNGRSGQAGGHGASEAAVVTSGTLSIIDR